MSFLSRFRYAIFLILLLITLLLGESFLRFIIFGLWGMFVVLQTKVIDFPQLARFRWISGSWIFLLWGILLSFIFSHSTASSLDSFSMWGVGFLLFHFFLLARTKNYFTSEHFELGVLLISVVMTAIGTVFFFLPELASRLPGMNIFHATYGHNHLAALLLLALPLSFHRLIRNFSVKNKSNFGFELLIFLIIFLGILFSFGRTVYVLTFVELAGLLWIFWDKLKKQKPISLYLQVSLAVSAIVIVTYFASSLLPSFLPNYSCPTFFQKVKMCKNLQTEGRWQYWQQGLRSFRDFPLSGYGPGTFSLLSKRYQQNQGLYTAYAHNFFIQQLAETGLVGVIPLLILLTSIIIYIWQQKLFCSDGQKVIILVLIVSAANSSLDFDWSFGGIFFLTLILLAMLLRSDDPPTPKNNSFEFSLYKLFFWLVAFFTLSVFVISTFTEVLVWQKKYNSILHTFPYFSSQRLLFLEQPLDLSDRQKLLSIYHSDSSMRNRLAKLDELSSSELFGFLFRQFELDPWSAIQPTTFYDNYVQRLSLENQQILLEKKMLFIYEKKIKNTLPLTYDQERDIVQQFLQFSDQLVADHEFRQIGKNYVLAHKFFNWCLSDHRPFFLDYQLTSEERRQFLQEINFVPGHFFGAYASEYAEEYFTLLDSEWSDLSVEEKQMLIGRILDSASWDLGRVSEVIKELSKKTWENQTEIDDKIVTMNNWSAMNQQLTSFSSYPIEEINWDNQDQFVRHLVKTANLAIEDQSDIEIIGNFYQQAMKFYPWILYEEKHWMDFVEWTELPIDKLKIYADQAIGWQADQIGWKVKEHVQMYQTLANWEIDQQQWSEAEKYLSAMQRVEGGVYWSKTQLGHFYLLRGEFEKAVQEYEQCLAESNNDHYECSVGLELARQKQQTAELYEQISQEIFDDQSW